MKIPLQVVREGDGRICRVVTSPDPDDTVVARGYHRDREYVCGNCGAPLLVGIRRAGLGNAVIKCAACGELNA